MAWDVTTTPPESFDEVMRAWRDGLAAKSTMDPAAWTAQAAQLRSLASTLRDSVLAVTPEHARLVDLVEEISKHLPERRTTLRP